MDACLVIVELPVTTNNSVQPQDNFWYMAKG